MTLQQLIDRLTELAQTIDPDSEVRTNGGTSTVVSADPGTIGRVPCVDLGLNP
jgi:hypothetical protein